MCQEGLNGQLTSDGGVNAVNTEHFKAKVNDNYVPLCQIVLD